MLVLSLLEAHWLDAPEPLDDQCAHGKVTLSVEGQDFVTPQDGEITVSAAALNLLRTVDHDHTRESPVSEGGQLFPCCGFNVLLTGDRFPVLILGCPKGVDLEIVHTVNGVVLRREDREALVSEHTWQRAVVSFADAVLEFYEREQRRNPIQNTEDREGWQAFWQEYAGRLERLRVAV